MLTERVTSRIAFAILARCIDMCSRFSRMGFFLSKCLGLAAFWSLVQGDTARSLENIHSSHTKSE
jgi:hypothetical protein